MVCDPENTMIIQDHEQTHCPVIYYPRLLFVAPEYVLEDTIGLTESRILKNSVCIDRTALNKLISRS